MPLPRPFRRKVKPLGTPDGNPSVLDDTLAEGPPIMPSDSVVGGVLSGIGYHALEKDAAAHADIEGDVASEFDDLGAAEDREMDALSGMDDGKDSKSL
jgi:hypothetical protein